MIVLVLFLFLSTALRAEDWPQFLGPTRNGIYTGSDLAASWLKSGPPQIWKKDIGQGFAAPVVVQGKLILFHRVGDREVVECLKAATGEPIWSSGYPTHYRDDFGFDEGPRGTPSVA
jgi:outer membrane protein assembly factor BamB